MSMKGREVRRSEGGSRWMAIRGKRSMQADEFIAVREEQRKAACHPRIGCSSLVQGKKGEKPPHLFFFLKRHLASHHSIQRPPSAFTSSACHAHIFCTLIVRMAQRWASWRDGCAVTLRTPPPVKKENQWNIAETLRWHPTRQETLDTFVCLQKQGGRFRPPRPLYFPMLSCPLCFLLNPRSQQRV